MPESLSLHGALAELKGAELSSVEFVRDYVQFHFDGPTLTAYTHPQLLVKGNTMLWGHLGYCEGLCALISVPVKEAQAIPNSAVTLIFENGVGIRISLEEKDYKGPEALQFENHEGRFWVV